jgi:protein-S-isoprenylcysteine O-methyltransferase Ste14
MLGVLGGAFGPRWPEAWRPWLWIIAVIAWMVAVPLAIGGGRELGRQLTPFPKPVEDGELKERRVYRYVRHPIYGGVLLLSLGWALVTSPLALIPSVLLALLFEGKRRREEAWLVERHPAYEDYRRRVRHRFIPFVW